MPSSPDEINRIKETYERRKLAISPHRYSFFNPGHLFMVQQRERELLAAFKNHQVTSLEDKKNLDLGCGRGGELRNFIRYGARPENLFGIDLLPDRIEAARSISPNINFRCENAENLPYDNNSFDVVMQFTVFTSILADNMKKTLPPKCFVC